MQFSRIASLFSAIILSLLLISCGTSVEGTYKIAKDGYEDATVTLGKSTFSFSTGASGTYEVSGDKVIFSGMTFTGTMDIEGNALVNEKWKFIKE